MRKFLRPLLAIAFTAGMLAGVSSVCVAADVPIQSSLIPADVVSQMTTASAPSGVSVRRWFDPALAKKKYRHVMINQVIYLPARPAASAQLSDSVIDYLPVALTDVLKFGIGQTMSVTTRPGPGTLSFRAAIVGVSAETESFKAKELLPIRLVFSAVEAATGTRANEPVVELHWSLRDSKSNKLLAAGIRKGVGDAIKQDTPAVTIDMLKPVIDAWVGDATDGFANLLH